MPETEDRNTVERVKTAAAEIGTRLRALRPNRSIRLLKEELQVRGVTTRAWTSASGRLVDGKPFSRGALYLILRNRIYLGEIVHKGQSHRGEHPPASWDGDWRRAPGPSRQSNGGSVSPRWCPNCPPGGWTCCAGPGVPTYWVWGPSGGAFEYPFADWRGPTGGWGNP